MRYKEKLKHAHTCGKTFVGVVLYHRRGAHITQVISFAMEMSFLAHLKINNLIRLVPDGCGKCGLLVWASFPSCRGFPRLLSCTAQLKCITRTMQCITL